MGDGQVEPRLASHPPSNTFPPCSRPCPKVQRRSKGPKDGQVGPQYKYNSPVQYHQ